MKRRLIAITLFAGAAWLTSPTTADAQGVFEGGIGYEIPSGTMSDYLNGGVDFALLLGYRFQQRYTVSFFGSLSLLTGKTVPVTGSPVPVVMPDLDQWRWGLGLDANVLNPQSPAELLVTGFLGFTTLGVPANVVCGLFCWTVGGASQTNFSTGIGAQFNYKVNRSVAVGVNAKYFWIFGVNTVSTVVGNTSSTLGSIPITGVVRVYQ